VIPPAVARANTAPRSFSITRTSGQTGTSPFLFRRRAEFSFMRIDLQESIFILARSLLNLFSCATLTAH
jgi:hypothetical protein